MAISANGMFEHINVGLNKKHNIPSKINKLMTPATIKLTNSRWFLLRSFPRFIITNEQKNVFCEAYIIVKNGKGKILGSPKYVTKFSVLTEQIKFNAIKKIIKGTMMLDNQPNFSKEFLSKMYVIAMDKAKYNILLPPTK